MSEPTIGELLQEADQLKWADPMKLELGEQAVRLADIENSDAQMFRARTHLISYATGCGAIDRAIVACAWCASRPEVLERLPFFLQWKFLWNYKHILHGAFQLPQITREKIEEILAQMSSFHETYGYNQRPTAYLRLVNQMNMGDFDGAAKSYAKFTSIPRDPMADCDACETNTGVEYLSLLRRDEDALEVARPLLDGSKSCVEVPHITYCRLLQPLLRLGDVQRADDFNRAGYAKIRSNQFLLKEAAIHIGFDTHRQKFTRAISRFERQLPMVMKSSELVERYCFFTVAGNLMERLSERSKMRKLDLPTEFPLHDQSCRYETVKLADWFEQQSASLAKSFDARNRNDFYSGQLRADLRFENVG